MNNNTLFTKEYFNFTSKRATKKFISCERKSSLTLKRANEIIKKEAKNKNLLSVYYCKYCNGWHLTHKK